jgi:hypothetical protein
MARWKLVPVEISYAMRDAWGVEDLGPGVSEADWRAMLAAAPKASEDEALVVKIADTIWEAMNVDESDPTSTRCAARAALKMLEGNHDR